MKGMKERSDNDASVTTRMDGDPDPDKLAITVETSVHSDLE